MNAKKVKQLRAFARDTAPKLPKSALVIGKTKNVKVPLFLDFRTAGKIAEDVAALMVADPIKGSADYNRLAALADIMAQYQKTLKMVYSDEAIADGNHVDHLPIKVYAVEQRVVAINSPQSQRGIYRQAKRLFRRVEREIGMARARP
jgi:membrane-bound lytic murein transglycosylase B